MTVEHLARVLAALDGVPATACNTAAAHVIDLANREGGTVTLGKRRRVVKLSAVARHPHGDPDRATIWGKPTGPWVWKNSGAAAHPIPRRARRKPRFLHAQGYEHPYNAHATLHHPGMRGRGAWRTVTTRARADVPKIYRTAIDYAVRHG